MSVNHRVLVDGKGKTEIKTLTARAAIQYHCKECMGFNANEVRHCTSKHCSLYPFRLHETPKGIE